MPNANTHALNPLPNAVLAYTDGACRGNGSDSAKGGFGAVLVMPDGEQVDLSGGEAPTTNNRMELMGAIVALENSPAQLPIQIWTDSGYVKNGITQWLSGWKKKGWRKADGKAVLNVDLWQRLDTASQHRQIDWQWVKGHAGHDGNEYADQLANQGIDNLPTPFTAQTVKKKPLTLPMTDSTMHPTNADNLPTMQQTEDEFLGSFFTDAADFNNSMDDSFEAGEIQLAENIATPPLPSATLSNAPSNSTLNPLTDPNLSRFTDNQGNFIAQDDELIAQRPEFNGNTASFNTFVPLLPIAKNKNASNRQLILDTETTGFDAQGADRVVEIGVVELINRKFTGEKMHIYINPERDMPEDAFRIHGISSDFLADKPTFAQVGQTVYDFLQGAELIAHNAGFDMGFLQAEFSRLGLPDFSATVQVTDSLALAKQQYPAQKNSLDALVKRLNVGKQDRTFHGALLDAEILAEVYLAMTGGQVSLAIDDMASGGMGAGEHLRFTTSVARYIADESTEQAHLAWINTLKDKNPQLAERWSLVEATLET